MVYLIDCVCAPVNVGVPVDGRGRGHPGVRGRMSGGGTSCFLIPWLSVRLQVGQVVPPMEDGLLAEVVEAVLEIQIEMGQIMWKRTVIQFFYVKSS